MRNLADQSNFKRCHLGFNLWMISPQTTFFKFCTDVIIALLTFLFGIRPISCFLRRSDVFAGWQLLPNSSPILFPICQQQIANGCRIFLQSGSASYGKSFVWQELCMARASYGKSLVWQELKIVLQFKPFRTISLE